MNHQNSDLTICLSSLKYCGIICLKEKKIAFNNTNFKTQAKF